MAQERLPPDAILAMTELSGVVGDIQDDPDSPDTNWLVASGNNVNTDVRTSFGTPGTAPKVGADLQEFRVLCRQFDEGQGGTPDGRVELWEDGGLIRAGSDTPIPQGGIVLSFTWNANELGTPDGSLVECKVVGTKSGGSPSNRNSTEVGAVEWNEEYSTGTIHEGEGQSDGTSTAAAAGNVEHAGDGQSDGTSTATGTGSRVFVGSAQSDGTSTATADGNVEHTGQAQSDGTSTATGTGNVIYAGAGQSNGTSTATGTGTTGTVHEGAGQSDGVSTASGAGNVEHTGAGQADGTSSATGSGVCILVGAGQSDGTSTATGTGQVETGAVEGAGQSDGWSTATGTAVVDFAGAGLSQGTSTATGTGVTSEFYDVVCTIGVAEIHRFEDHTEENAQGVANAMVAFSPSLDWTHPQPTVWLGNGDRKIELVGA
jgi:hypothetical protein